jgi:hypothetical protein
MAEYKAGASAGLVLSPVICAVACPSVAEKKMEPELLNQLLKESGPLLLVSLLISVGCALLCGVIAARRRARWVYWSVMGFAFGPFALPFVFMAKPKPPKDATS